MPAKFGFYPTSSFDDILDVNGDGRTDVRVTFPDGKIVIKKRAPANMKLVVSSDRPFAREN